MRINFGKLEIHNFKSFLDETFDFSSMSGMTLVCGKNHDIPGQANSAGKSSIFDALLYALFGQLQTSVKNKNLKNRYSEDDSMVVKLFFNIDKKNYFKVERGLNKYGQSFLKVFAIIDGVEEELTKSSVYETEAFLENELLHCDVSIFLRTILLSSDQNYNFFLLSKGGKKDFVEKLFNIRVFGEMYNLIHRDILDFEKEFSSKQTTLLMLNKSKSDFEERLAKFDEEQKEKTAAIKNKILSLQSSLKELREKKVVVNEEEISKYEDKANKLIEKRREVSVELQELSKKDKNILSKKIKLEAAKANDEKTIASYSSLLEKLCDKCKPIVSSYYNLDKVNEHIRMIENSIGKLIKDLTDIENESNALNEKLVKIDAGKELIEKKIHEMTDESNKIMLRITSLQNEIAFNESALGRIESETNPYKQLYEETSEKIEKENLVLNEMNVKYSYMKMSENIVSQDTLKKFIIKDLVTLLNSKIKYYLMKLGAKYTCIFNEDMDYTFITPDGGGETEYATFSAGERMRLSIASSFAFRDFMGSRNNFTSNILILDEFIDSAIDTLAVTNILHLLQEFSRINNQHILIISHRKEIDNSIFDNIVMVEKRQNISTISYLPPEK